MLRVLRGLRGFDCPWQLHVRHWRLTRLEICAKLISALKSLRVGFQYVKFFRHSDGDRPNLFLKCGRMADALAKPVASATFSMEHEVVSKRR
jgi:hypothetical protein